MQRPRRQAAVEAIAKIQRVREWETLPESSKRFRECAAQIEAEFRAEEHGQNVSADDLDGAGESDEEQSEAYSDANESFVDDDYEAEDTEYHPAAEELAEDLNEEPDELQDEEDEEDEEEEEEEDEEEAEALGDEEEEEEQPEEHQKEAEEPEEAEEDDRDGENHAILQ